jgi:hypothetical protein
MIEKYISINIAQKLIDPVVAQGIGHDDVQAPFWRVIVFE